MSETLELDSLEGGCSLNSLQVLHFLVNLNESVVERHSGLDQALTGLFQVIIELLRILGGQAILKTGSVENAVDALMGSLDIDVCSLETTCFSL